MDQKIIQPVSKELLKKELTADKQMRSTNKSHNEIYVLTAHNAPNVMQEIGRLREIFRYDIGEGRRGKPARQERRETIHLCFQPPTRRCRRCGSWLYYRTAL